MKIFKLKPLSICDTNSYLVISQQSNAVLIDAPADADHIMDQLEFYGCTLKKIFLTHGHFDHTGAVAELVERTGCEVFIHPNDARMLASDGEAGHFRIRNHRPYTGKVTTFTEDDILTLDELEFDVLETPGHTNGSVCFICGEHMFSGDTLFARSIGRTDLADGDEVKMAQSLAKIADLAGEDLQIYPGHMRCTTLNEELRVNPYLNRYAGGGR